jgi:TetR/AcrR family transcriptional repressor of bet genes
MARPPNTDQRRAQIVAALRRVMARTGYERATVAAIAKDAGLSTGLVHYHFANKQEILLALARQLASEVDARAGSGGGDPREAVLRWVEAHVAQGAGADPDAVACWIEIGAEALHQPEVAAVWKQVVAERHDALTGLLRAAGCAEPKANAAVLLGAIEGAWRLGLGAPGVLPAGFAAPGLRAVAEGMVGAPVVAAGFQPAAAQPNDDWAVWR